MSLIFRIEIEREGGLIENLGGGFSFESFVRNWNHWQKDPQILKVVRTDELTGMSRTFVPHVSSLR